MKSDQGAPVVRLSERRRPTATTVAVMVAAVAILAESEPVALVACLVAVYSAAVDVTRWATAITLRRIYGE